MLFINKRTGAILKPVNKDVIELYKQSKLYEPYKPTKAGVKPDKVEDTKPVETAEEQLTAETAEPTKPAKGKK